MHSLNYLLFNRLKASIRKLFSSATSIILLGIFVILCLFVIFSFSQIDLPLSQRVPYPMALVTYLGFMFILVASFYVQKHSAFVNINDAHYLLTGPFTQKQFILYGCLSSLSIVFTYWLITFGYFGMNMASVSTMHGFDIYFLAIHTFLIYSSIIALYDFLYLKLLTHPKRILIRRMIVLFVVLWIALVFAYYYINVTDHNIEHIISQFMYSEAFNFIPIFGWARFSLIAMHKGHILSSLISLFGIILINIVIIVLTVNIKNVDVEVIMDDSLVTAKLRDKSQANNIYANLEAKEVKTVRFKTGALAISSRLLLEMRKTKAFITSQEIALIITYLFISIVDKFSFAFYSRYILIIIFIITTNANYNDELKHHYLYLIPAKALNKLVALLLPTILKLIIVVGVTLTFGIVLKPTFIEFIFAFIEVLAYSLLFVAANIWSLRILKQASSPVTNNLIKMFIIILAVSPSIILGLMFNFLSDANVFSIVSSVVNIIMAFIFIYASKGVVTGVYLIES